MKQAQGFTLIEIIVVVAIIGILASIAFPVASMVSQRARESELRLALRDIRNAIDRYKDAADSGLIEKPVGDSGYPKKLEELVTGKPDVKSPERKMIYFLRKLPRDPFYSDSTTPAAQTWGKRSYASPPDDPQEGKDVYDIYSLSDREGLNGVPLREW